MTSRRVRQMQALCPQCRRRRFIPHYTAPFCTPSCKRDAATEAATAAREEDR